VTLFINYGLNLLEEASILFYLQQSGAIAPVNQKSRYPNLGIGFFD
jgi:hypothetical protein